MMHIVPWLVLAVALALTTAPASADTGERSPSEVLSTGDHVRQQAADSRMGVVWRGMVVFSALGVGLLCVPLLRRERPRRARLRNAALVALAFAVVVNVFGAALCAVREAQRGSPAVTNASLALTRGTFEAARDHLPDLTLALEAVRRDPALSPVRALTEGAAVVRDSSGMRVIASMFGKLDYVYGIVPAIFMTAALLVALGVARSALRGIAEARAEASSPALVLRPLRAVIYTAVIAVGLTLVSALLLATTAKVVISMLPIILASSEPDASTALTCAALFSVIVVCVFSLGTKVVSTTLALRKTHGILEQHVAGTPLRSHRSFLWTGGASLALVQLYPLGFALVVVPLLGALASVLNASAFLIVTPLVLAVMLFIMFRLVRGFRAIKFLANYRLDSA